MPSTSEPLPWLSVDPGESTGWALWRGGKLLDAGTFDLWKFIDLVELGIEAEDGPFAGAALLVVEDWAIYPWEAQNLAWDKCRTARGIGALEYICRRNNVRMVLQPAKIKQQALANAAEHLFSTPLHENRHQNDAVMHGVFYQAQTFDHPLKAEGVDGD